MLYFAYGSNLNLTALKRLAPQARPVGAAVLEGYRLVFRRYCDITPDAKGKVHGAVYEITPACERALDAYEGFPTLYRKVDVAVEIQGEKRAAMVYVMNQTDLAPPEVDYFTMVTRGYRDWKLDTAALRAARLEAAQGMAPAGGSGGEDINAADSDRRRRGER